MPQKPADALDLHADMRAPLVPMPGGVVSGVVEGNGSQERRIKLAARLVPFWALDLIAIFELNFASGFQKDGVLLSE